MYYRDSQALIIGLCGRLWQLRFQSSSGKSELAQIISVQSRDECQVIFLKETLNLRNFFEDALNSMEKSGFDQDISVYDEIKIEELEKLLREIHLKHFHPTATFHKLEDALCYCTDTQVLYPITVSEELNLLYQRNYFHLIAIETPVAKRYQNFKKKYAIEVSFQLFCIIDEILSENIQEYMHKAKINLRNVGDQTELLISFFKKLSDVFRPIRPDWDQYFMRIANVVKQRSNCMKRAVGVVIVKNNRIVATGYNGTPNGKQNCWEDGCDRCNANTKQGVDLEKCFCFHAEESAILEIGTKKSKEMIMYTTLFPCLQCTKIILATKIKTIYFEEDYDNSAAKSELHKYMKVHQIDSSHYVY